MNFRFGHQRAPELASYLQGMVDDDPTPGRFVLTGSQNLVLMDAVSQSLAGRAALVELLPLDLAEVRRFTRPPEEDEAKSVIVDGAYIKMDQPIVSERLLMAGIRLGGLLNRILSA